MTAQEIDDVRGRTERPDLELLIRTGQGALNNDGSGYETRADFEIANTSQVTASFAVVSVGFIPPDGITCQVEGAGGRSTARTAGQ